MKKISFDFDGTLEDDFDGTPNKQKEEIQTIARKFISEGHQVCIITKRYGPEFSNMGISNEHNTVLNLAKKLGIKDVYFTNREMKDTFIESLGIQIHFENSDYEVDLISKYFIDKSHNCLVIPVEDPYWRDLIY
jgi:hypothetical protein